jgi:putative glycosyltransferase (TIGR04348 family)
VGRLPGTIAIVNPAPQLRGGNRVTALRWARIFRRLGCRVFQEESWSGRECDLLVALHARRSHDSVVRFAREHPELPIVVAATGTDVYTDVPDSGEASESFGLATRIVVLQPLASEKLPEDSRPRARVIYQSVRQPRVRPPPVSDAFEVCVIAHLRPVKDPLRAALAARLLPASSRIRIVHVGGLVDERMPTELERETAQNPRFRWLGDLPRSQALGVLARSRLFVTSSRHEGGANAVSEALAFSVPILATRIPGTLGLLGDDYPGTFAVEDTDALAKLLQRAETEPDFLRALEKACRARAWITAPESELASWRELLDELSGDRTTALTGEHGGVG